MRRILGLIPAVLGALSFHTLAAGSAPSRKHTVAPETVWTINSGEIDPKRYFGETLANGMIGILSAPAPFETAQTLLNGAYERSQSGRTNSIVHSFDFLDLSFSIDGERIERFEQVRNFRQRLDMRRAAFTTSFEVGDKASVSYTLRALRQFPYSGLLDITVVARRPITIEPSSRFQAPDTLVEVRAHDTTVGTYASDRDPRHALKLRAASAKSRFGRHIVAAAQGFMFHESPIEAPAVKHEKDGLVFSKILPAGVTYHFALVGSTLATAHVGDPFNEAQRLTAFIAVQKIQELIDQHEREWLQLWKSDIVIDGDNDTQRDVRSMLYHLYSFVREGSEFSIPPMGLSNTGYNGHIFWDAEMWMLPALLMLKPDLARTMLEYRFVRLTAAKRNAAAHGYRGAMFPWESAESGDEETEGFLTGPLQHHITADVGIAAWNYFRVTQDRQWLRDRGYPLLEATADFWTSRVSREGPGRFNIKKVIAADEYAEFVDNDAFTNAAARQNLAAAKAAAELLGLTPNPDWLHVRQNIPILKFPDGVTREHATYGGEQLKQADVNLLSFPLQEITDPEAIKRDLDYYGSRLDLIAGPAMAKPIFAILYHRLGMTEKAFELFKSGYHPNQRPPFGVITECAKCSNPYFATGAGGLLQALLYGFGGLDIMDRGITQRATALPTQWKSITLTGVGPLQQTFVVKRSSALPRSGVSSR